MIVDSHSKDKKKKKFKNWRKVRMNWVKNWLKIKMNLVLNSMKIKMNRVKKLAENKDEKSFFVFFKLAESKVESS